MHTLGDRIKHLRGTNSQRWLSDKLGIPQTTLSNYENNKSELNFAMIDAFKTIFSVNTDWLLFGRGPMHADETPEAQGLSCGTPPPSSCRLCTQCTKLEAKLEKVEAERLELSSECRKLWQENGDLRERCATLEERQKHCDPEGVFSKHHPIQSNSLPHKE